MICVLHTWYNSDST